MKATRLLVLLALLALGVGSGASWAEKFETNPGDAGSLVTFEVSAPLETIVGTNAVVEGHFDFDPGDVKASSEGMFVVDVSQFNTGIDLRDQHLRDRFLHTEKFPKATFTLGRIRKASRKSIKSGQSVELEIEGTIDMHGVKRKEKAKATVTYLDSEAAGGVLPGNVLAIKASFQVALADYNIERPQMLVLKVGEVVDVNLVARLTDSPKMSEGSCGGCGGSCGGSEGSCGGCGGSCGGSEGSCGGSCGGSAGSCGGSCGGSEGSCGGCGGSCGGSEGGCGGSDE